MARFIHFIDDQKRDAQVTFSSLNPKAKVRMVLPDGSAPETLRVIKDSATTAVAHLCDALIGPLESPDGTAELVREIELAEHIIESDPEVDLELHGKFITDADRVYVNPQMRPVFRLKEEEHIFSAKRELVEKRTPRVVLSNIAESDMVKWSGKMLPKRAIIQKVLLTKKYQVKHINGLTFSFLFDLAKQLNENEALMPVGAGEKGNQPLIMSDGGKPYRAFLEGRVRGDSYCLILHLTDQELKAPQNDEA